MIFRPPSLPHWTLAWLILVVPQVVLCAEGLVTAVRRPAALATSGDGTRLYVANRDSGTLSTINVALRCVVAEQDVGRRLSDVVFLGASSRLLATDEANHELLVLETCPESSRLKIMRRLAVSPYPVSI